MLNGTETLHGDIVMKPAEITQQITVEENPNQLSVDPSQNADALLIKGADLDALPDDPDDLQQDLQALAGPSAGPNGGQIFVDGFSSGRLPPRIPSARSASNRIRFRRNTTHWVSAGSRYLPNPARINSMAPYSMTLARVSGIRVTRFWLLRPIPTSSYKTTAGI
jgi:hypothetical protein